MLKTIEDSILVSLIFIGKINYKVIISNISNYEIYLMTLVSFLIFSLLILSKSFSNRFSYPYALLSIKEFIFSFIFYYSVFYLLIILMFWGLFFTFYKFIEMIKDNSIALDYSKIQLILSRYNHCYL